MIGSGWFLLVLLLALNLLTVAAALLAGLLLQVLRPFTSARRPPAVPGCPGMSMSGCVRLWWWAQTGFRHGIRRGSCSSRAFSLLLWGFWWVYAPALLAAQFAVVMRPWTRYYLSPARDAVLAVSGHRHSWSIGDHACARPGTRQGRALRKLLLPMLTSYADELGVAITTTAAVPALARMYAKALPGLEVTGRARPRGLRMRREPERHINLTTPKHLPSSTTHTAPTEETEA